MTHYGIIEDYDYNETHKRQRLTLWSGPFASVREGEAYALPSGAGFMVSLEYGEKVRVACPAPRTAENWMAVDEAINEALNAHAAAQEAKQAGPQRFATVEWPSHWKGWRVQIVDSPADGVYNTILPTGAQHVFHADNLNMEGAAADS